MQTRITLTQHDVTAAVAMYLRTKGYDCSNEKLLVSHSAADRNMGTDYSFSIAAKPIDKTGR